MSATDERMRIEYPDIRERRWSRPPRDRTVAIVPSDGRKRAARAVAAHIEKELARGRPLYCVVRDEFVARRIGEFDGLALPTSCLPEEDR